MWSNVVTLETKSKILKFLRPSIVVDSWFFIRDFIQIKTKLSIGATSVDIGVHSERFIGRLMDHKSCGAASKRARQQNLDAKQNRGFNRVKAGIFSKNFYDLFSTTYYIDFDNWFQKSQIYFTRNPKCISSLLLVPVCFTSLGYMERCIFSWRFWIMKFGFLSTIWLIQSSSFSGNFFFNFGSLICS